MANNKATLERNGFEVYGQLQEERYWVSSERDYNEDLVVLCRIGFSPIKRSPEGITTDMLVQGPRDPGVVMDPL